jgi:disulfide bond formation protein DsbB
MDRALVSRWFFAVVVAASMAALGTALVAQYGFGLEPCVLCQYQRIPYWVAAGAALVALWVPTSDRGGIALVVAFIFACGAALAAYHFGVEQKWWHAATACAAQGGLPMSFDAFREGPLTPIAKPCDAVDWTIFGISITAYNAVLSALLAVAALLAAPHLWEPRR